MLQEIKDLQLNAVLSLLNVISRQKEATFRAPTGSGKTDGKFDESTAF